MVGTVVGLCAALFGGFIPLRMALLRLLLTGFVRFGGLGLRLLHRGRGFRRSRRLLYRRLGVCAINTSEDDGIFQLNLFTDYDALEREKKIQRAMQEVRLRYGPNAVFKGMNLLEGATTLERNRQIGGHKA